MNFKEHSGGGLLTAIGTTIGYVTCKEQLPLDDILSPVLFVLTYGFALFPDLDTKSTPQKWFFRILFFISCFLMYRKEFEICSMILLTSILPLLFKHRGFTHWWSMAFIGPILLMAGFEVFILRNEFILEPFFLKYGWYMIGCSFGWITHLILDVRKFKKWFF